MHRELTKEPYALYFYLTYSKLMMKGENMDEEALSSCIELMRRAFKNISEPDLEAFLYHNTDVAVQIVTDLLEVAGPGQINSIDKETKQFALKLRKHALYKPYKSILLSGSAVNIN